MGFNDGFTTMNGRVVFATPKAILFEGYFMDGQEWMPRSQCIIEYHPDAAFDGEATIMVKDWLAKKNGWEDG